MFRSQEGADYVKDIEPKELRRRVEFWAKNYFVSDKVEEILAWIKKQRNLLTIPQVMQYVSTLRFRLEPPQYERDIWGYAWHAGSYTPPDDEWKSITDPVARRRARQAAWVRAKRINDPEYSKKESVRHGVYRSSSFGFLARLRRDQKRRDQRMRRTEAQIAILEADIEVRVKRLGATPIKLESGFTAWSVPMSKSSEASV